MTVPFLPWYIVFIDPTVGEADFFHFSPSGQDCPAICARLVHVQPALYSTRMPTSFTIGNQQDYRTCCRLFELTRITRYLSRSHQEHDDLASAQHSFGLLCTSMHLTNYPYPLYARRVFLTRRILDHSSHESKCGERAIEAQTSQPSQAYRMP